MTVTDAVAEILSNSLSSRTPQELAGKIRTEYPELGSTPGIRRAVTEGRHESVEAALTASIYTLAARQTRFEIDRSTVPYRLSLSGAVMRNLPSISSFFRDTLELPRSNDRWSWGAFDNARQRIVLQVWRDQLSSDEEGTEKVQVLGPDWVTSRRGYDERMRHLEAMRAGTFGYAVICEAVDVRVRPRRIRGFSSDLWRLAPPVWMDDGNVYCTLQQPVSVRAFVAGEEACAAEIVEEVGGFDPFNATDARERQLADVVRRKGQPEFRRSLLEAYSSTCAITGCSAACVLEAAHILPYRGEHTNHVTNGILLRTDIHTLFDLHLVSVQPAGMVIRVSKQLAGTEYAEFEGRQL